MRDVDQVMERQPSAVRVALVGAGLAMLVGAVLTRSPLAIAVAIGFAVVLVRWSGVAVSATEDSVTVRNTWRTTVIPWDQVQGWLIVGNGIAVVRKGAEGDRPIQVAAVRSSISSPERRFEALQSITQRLGSMNPDRPSSPPPAVGG